MIYERNPRMTDKVTGIKLLRVLANLDDIVQAIGLKNLDNANALSAVNKMYELLNDMAEVSRVSLPAKGIAERKTMTREDHTKRHKQLHAYLDELVADFIGGQPYPSTKMPSNTTVMELMEWSYGQTFNPTDVVDK